MLDNKRDGYGLGALEMMLRYEALLQAMSKTEWKNLKRDVLFQKLSRRYRLVILTNENLRTQLKKLQAIDPKEKYFERVFTSEEVGEEKPSAKGFQLCLRYLKLPPKNVLSVGNSLEGDIVPAMRLGMQGILTREFLPSGGRVPKGCVSVETLSELSGILKL